MVTVRVCSKLKTSRKSLVFTNKVGKNYRYFVGVLNKTIIQLALVGHDMIIANSASLFIQLFRERLSEKNVHATIPKGNIP